MDSWEPLTSTLLLAGPSLSSQTESQLYLRKCSFLILSNSHTLHFKNVPDSGFPFIPSVNSYHMLFILPSRVCQSRASPSIPTDWLHLTPHSCGSLSRSLASPSCPLPPWTQCIWELAWHNEESRRVTRTRVKILTSLLTNGMPWGK